VSPPPVTVPPHPPIPDWNFPGGGRGVCIGGGFGGVNFGDAHALAIRMLQSVSAVFTTQAAAQQQQQQQFTGGAVPAVSAADSAGTPPAPGLSLPFASSRVVLAHPPPPPLQSVIRTSGDDQPTGVGAVSPVVGL
jgi:hypothetical protein